MQSATAPMNPMNLTAPPAQDPTGDTEIRYAKPAEQAIICVLYVGDILTLRQKQTPIARLGGKLYPWPNFLTVPNNIVRKCEITRLKSQGMRSVHKASVPEDDWTGKGWNNSYIQANWWNPATQQYEDKEIGVEGPSEYLLYKPLPAAREAGKIAVPETGCVQLGPEAGIATAGDIREAQLFIFPEWRKIIMGREELPFRLRDLEEHINDRLAVAHSLELKSICNSYLVACQDFRTWARGYIDFQTRAIKETDKWPGGVAYDEIAERLFDVVGLQREDRLVQDMASRSQGNDSLNERMVALMEMMAKNQSTAGVVTAPVTVAPQPAAPATLEEADAEIQRASEVAGDVGQLVVTASDINRLEQIATPPVGVVEEHIDELLEQEGFTDMSLEVVAPVDEAEVQEVKTMLSEAGVATIDEELD